MKMGIDPFMHEPMISRSHEEDQSSSSQTDQKNVPSDHETSNKDKNSGALPTEILDHNSSTSPAINCSSVDESINCLLKDSSVWCGDHESLMNNSLWVGWRESQSDR